jgi:hypothetical protein
MGEMRKTKFSPGKPEGKRPLGRQKLRWENNIKTYTYLQYESVDWIHLCQDRFF